MPIAVFQGYDPKHPPTERAHKTQTVGVPANEDRRVRLLRGIGPIPPHHLWTPADIAAAVLPRRITVPPPSSQSGAPITVGPPLLRNLVFSDVSDIGGGAQLSLPIPFPGFITHVSLSAGAEITADANPNGGQITATMSPNAAATVAELRAGTPIFPIQAIQNPLFVNSVVIPAGARVEFPMRLPLSRYPGFINVLFNAFAGGHTDFNATFTLEQASPSQVAAESQPYFDDGRFSSVVGATLFPRPPNTASAPRPTARAAAGPPETLRVSVFSGGQPIAFRDIPYADAAPYIRRIADANAAAALTGGRIDPTVQAI